MAVASNKPLAKDELVPHERYNGTRRVPDVESNPDGAESVASILSQIRHSNTTYTRMMFGSAKMLVPSFCLKELLGSAKATTNAAPADGSSSLQPSLLGIPPRPSPPAPAPKLVARIEDFPSHLPRGQTTAAATADITGNYTMVKLPSTSADLTRLPAASFERVEAIWAIVTGWTYLDEVEGRICELIHQMFVPWVPIDFTKNLRFYIRHIPKLLQVGNSFGVANINGALHGTSVILWTIGAYLLPIKFTVYVGINFPRLASKELKNMIFAWSKGQAIQYAAPPALVRHKAILRMLRAYLWFA
eukprot:jgi/Bigna1/79182/fgenesh1_pg.60_\